MKMKFSCPKCGHIPSLTEIKHLSSDDPGLLFKHWHASCGCQFRIARVPSNLICCKCKYEGSVKSYHVDNIRILSEYEF